MQALEVFLIKKKKKKKKFKLLGSVICQASAYTYFLNSTIRSNDFLFFFQKDFKDEFGGYAGLITMTRYATFYTNKCKFYNIFTFFTSSIILKKFKNYFESKKEPFSLRVIILFSILQIQTFQ